MCVCVGSDERRCVQVRCVVCVNLFCERKRARARVFPCLVVPLVYVSLCMCLCGCGFVTNCSENPCINTGLPHSWTRYAEKQFQNHFLSWR